MKEEEEAFFLSPLFFFLGELNALFLACVSMVMVPRTVWRCSKLEAWNNQEGSVAPVTPNCQSFPINRSLFCIVSRRSHLEWIRVFKGESRHISPYARTESINTSRTQKQTCWCNRLALRLSLSFQIKAPQPFFWTPNQKEKNQNTHTKKTKTKTIWTQRLSGEEVHLTQCIVTL